MSWPAPTATSLEIILRPSFWEKNMRMSSRPCAVKATDPVEGIVAQNSDRLWAKARAMQSREKNAQRLNDYLNVVMVVRPLRSLQIWHPKPQNSASRPEPIHPCLCVITEHSVKYHLVSISSATALNPLLRIKQLWGKEAHSLPLSS